MYIIPCQPPVEIGVQSTLFTWKSTVFSQRFNSLLVPRELCRSRGVVSGRSASPAGPSPQGTRFGNGGGPSNPVQIGRDGACSRLQSQVGRPTGERSCTLRCVVGRFCERVSELSLKYTLTPSVRSQEMPARKSGDQFGRNDQRRHLGYLLQRETLEAAR